MTADHATATAPSTVGSPRGNGEHDEPATSSRRRRLRRRQALAGVAVLAGLVIAAVVARRDGGGEGGATAAATTSAAVEVRDLVQTDEYDGELGYGEAHAVTAGRGGVVTGATPVGTTVGQGDALFDLDLQPTVLLHGDVPAFRDLSVDADPGADITQVE